MLIYAVINYNETKRRGYPLYWFLTWEDWTTPVIYLALLVVFVIIWVGLAKALARQPISVSKVN